MLSSRAAKKVLNYIQFKYLKAFTVACISGGKKIKSTFYPERSTKEEGEKFQRDLLA